MKQTRGARCDANHTMSLSVRALIEAFQAPDLQADGEYELRSYAEESSLVFAVAEQERMQREPETVEAHRLHHSAVLEPVARRVVEMMAFAQQARLLVRHSAPAVADAFCATRLEGD